MTRTAISLGVLLSLMPAISSAVDYEQEIKPLLKQRCSSCHGRFKQAGDLRLDAGALIPKAIHAELLKRISSSDESERMPPEGARLTSEQIAALRSWISAGAPYPADEIVPKTPAEHWAFQPVRRPPVPSSIHNHPIDAFVFGEQPGIEPAARHALLRRVYLDLIGLPPNLSEQDRFVADGNLSVV